MPCADSSTICARRQVNTDPVLLRMIRRSRPPSSVAAAGWGSAKRLPWKAKGTLGTGVDALAVALGNGGAFTVFATVAVTWLKRRTGRMEVKIIRADGSTVEVSSDLVRPQTAQELRETAERLARDLAPAPEGTVDG
ncbi:hypothetical protein ACFWOJ_24180 [Streptomyces sp. NPDC058439]|uniref:effector-associated constant component EACC1 n=1 Tax=Streptomyces sp. NPDC058439 TaxID=3346500 RepID=UPI00365820FF